MNGGRPWFPTGDPQQPKVKRRDVSANDVASNAKLSVKVLVIVRWRGFLEDPEESASHQWSKTLTTTLANSHGIT